MLRLSDRPPEGGHGPGLRLMRTPSGVPFVGIITCAKVIGVSTHYYGGRTMPCQPPECPACTDGVPWRWHGYLSCLNKKTREHVLFELTAQAAETVIQYGDQHGTLRGSVFQATRPGYRTNGRVYVQIKAWDGETIVLPDEPKILRALCVVWNLPFSAIETPDNIKGTPHVDVDVQRVRDLQLAPERRSRNGAKTRA